MQTTWEIPKYSTDKTVVPLRKQKDNPNSLYNFYKSWIAYRNSSECMTFGDLSATPFHIREVISAVRTRGDKKCLALHNLSDVEITVSLDEVAEFNKIDFSTSSEISLSGNKLKLPAYSSAVLKN